MSGKQRRRPSAEKILSVLRTSGRLSAAEIEDITGVSASNVHAGLAHEIAAGSVAVASVKQAGRRRFNVYAWCGEVAAVSPVQTVAGSAPRDPSMRRCLGADCGRMFKSAHAGNRLCPRCAAWARQQADAGTFDSAHSVIRR